MTGAQLSDWIKGYLHHDYNDKNNTELIQMLNEIKKKANETYDWNGTWVNPYPTITYDTNNPLFYVNSTPSTLTISNTTSK